MASVNLNHDVQLVDSSFGVAKGEHRRSLLAVVLVMSVDRAYGSVWIALGLGMPLFAGIKHPVGLGLIVGERPNGRL